ncbi:hypothetical protein BH24ACT9_BH24ACT9_11000 [soil metagenome]
MNSRTVERGGLVLAWACIVAVRVIDGFLSGGDDSLAGLLGFLEVASWGCVGAVIIACSRRGGKRWVDPTSLPVRVLSFSLLVLIGAGIFALVTFDGGADIGLGFVYLVGLVSLAAATVLVVRPKPRV